MGKKEKKVFTQSEMQDVLTELAQARHQVGQLMNGLKAILATKGPVEVQPETFRDIDDYSIETSEAITENGNVTTMKVVKNG
jgi:hypothetical protein